MPSPTFQEARWSLLVIQHVDREGPGVIAELASERGMAIRTIRPDRGELLPDPALCTNTIALVLGGPMGVNERHQPGMTWLNNELTWILSLIHISEPTRPY